MRYIQLLVLIAVLAGCKADYSKVDQVKWIEGTWVLREGDSDIEEKWYKADDTSYFGTAMVRDTTGRMLYTEEIKIVLREGKLQYIPIVSNQNDGQPVAFTEVSMTDTSILFENAEHDFPQRISYTLTSDKTIEAYIDGTIDDTVRKTVFNYVKL